MKVAFVVDVVVNTAASYFVVGAPAIFSLSAVVAVTVVVVVVVVEVVSVVPVYVVAVAVVVVVVVALHLQSGHSSSNQYDESGTPKKTDLSVLQPSPPSMQTDARQ